MSSRFLAMRSASLVRNEELVIVSLRVSHVVDGLAVRPEDGNVSTDADLCQARPLREQGDPAGAGIPGRALVARVLRAIVPDAQRRRSTMGQRLSPVHYRKGKRMSKIVIIGAGSGFGGKLSIDIMSRECLRDSTICLCDIHPGRLEKVAAYVQRTVDAHGLPTKVVASTDRRDVLPDADFVVTSISAGGGAYYGFPFSAEVEIPREYGVDQSVADTVSVGAVFRFLRTAPVHLQIFRDVERLAPNAIVLNHTNPMCMLTWVQWAATNVPNYGICHGVQGTSRGLANRIGVPYDEVSFVCAGINHLAWFISFRRGKEDLYPRIHALLDDPEKMKGEEVRFELLKHFGYFPTESNHHDSEYLPYFRRTPELMDHYQLKPRIVPTEAPHKREWLKDTGVDGDESAPVGELRRSHEYTTGIMEAIVSDVPYEFNGNVMNNGLITNLPNGCCVEVPCLVNGTGVHPCHVGDIPPQLAALDRSNIAVQELAVKAVIERNREAAYHAVCLDPLTASVLPLPKIREMFDRMWDAEKDLLTYYDGADPVPELCAD